MYKIRSGKKNSGSMNRISHWMFYFLSGHRQHLTLFHEIKILIFKSICMKSKNYYSGKRISSIFLALISMLFIASISFGQSPVLTVISPNGGESIVGLSTVQISWENTGGTADLMVEYTEDGGNYWYYLGFIPASDTISSIYAEFNGNATEMAKIRISEYNDPANFDESDNYFTIVEPPVYFSSPYFGSMYYASHPVLIYWYSYTLDTFDIDYSLDNGQTWTNIATGFTGFEYSWTAPDQTSNTVLIKIAEASNPSNYGLSPLFSIIEEPVLNLTSPNGGETWNYGENATVSWTGSNLQAYVQIEFSADGGTTWNSLGYGYNGPDGGAAEVYVPYISATNALVRIMDYSYYFELDRSDAPFSIVVPPVIVYYPAGGEQYYNNQQMYFSWMASQDISTLNIELSTDGGQSWQLVDQNIPAGQGYYYWTVSGTPSQNCLIRISDSEDDSQSGLSGVFTILETPVITLTSPVGGEIWNTNESYTISWTYDNPNSSYVYIEYSTDNGTTWNFINYAALEGTEGSIDWITPDINSNQCLIRVMDYYLTFVNTTSSAFTILPYPETPICMVTVDSATNRNVVVWEKPVSDLIDKFVVYKESDEANIYQVIGTVDYYAESVITDTNSNPNMKSYRYKLGFQDSEGNVFPAGGLHQTIHLTINQGVGNSWNLIWTGYVGFEVPSYNIYRKTGTGSYEKIATISANFTSYTDLSAPQGGVYYIIEVVNPNGCNPGRAGEYGSSWSNVATNSFTGVSENISGQDVKTYPNPANDKLFVALDETLQGSVRIVLNDLLGHLVYSQEVESLKSNSVFTINTSDFKEGIYMLQIITNSGNVTRKLMVKH